MPEKTCPSCGCATNRTTARTPIDRSLAFTAMLERYPGFGQMTDAEATPLIDEFLADWYGSGHTDMYAYAGEWATRDRAKTQPVTGAPQPDVHGIRAETARMRDAQLAAQQLGIPTDASLGLTPPNADGNPYTEYTPEHRVWARAQENGKAAASWVVDGNTSRDSARWLVKGIEDGDPLVMDSVREPSLSSEYEGDYSEDELMSDAGWVPHDGTDLRDELATQYLTQVAQAFWHEVERLARIAAG